MKSILQCWKKLKSYLGLLSYYTKLLLNLLTVLAPLYQLLLSDSERKYSQIEKQTLACVVGVTRFRSFLYGHKFILQTDHKPLLSL